MPGIASSARASTTTVPFALRTPRKLLPIVVSVMLVPSAFIKMPS